MALTRSVAQIFTGDRQVDDSARFVGTLARSVNSVPFLDGRLVEDVSLSAGVETSVEHKLGRSVRGFFPVYTQESGGYVTIQRLAASTDAPLETHVRLKAQASCTVSLWVY